MLKSRSEENKGMKKRGGRKCRREREKRNGWESDDEKETKEREAQKISGNEEEEERKNWEKRRDGRLYQRVTTCFILKSGHGSLLPVGAVGRLAGSWPGEEGWKRDDARGLAKLPSRNVKDEKCMTPCRSCSEF